MTSLRDIVVVLDDTARSKVWLAIAVHLAQQHDAHLTGISALDLVTPPKGISQPRHPIDMDSLYPSQPVVENAMRSRDYPDAITQVAERAEQIEAAFREQLRGSRVRGDWRMANEKSSEAFASQTRYTDLVILGQIDPNHPPPPAGRHLVEETLMTAGRPILIIPYAGHFNTIGSKVLIGWNNSREAARAVYDAIPLLAKATSVTILEAYPAGRIPGAHDITSTGITRYLAHHEIDARTERTAMTSISADDALLSYAADISADLLVVGGYGHSRLRELILGGVTRGLLQHMTVPVLMSH